MRAVRRIKYLTVIVTLVVLLQLLSQNFAPSHDVTSCPPDSMSAFSSAPVENGLQFDDIDALPAEVPEPTYECWPNELFRWQTTFIHDQASAHLFSAFHDPKRNPPAIVIVGVSTGGRPVMEYCRIWYEGSSEMNTSSVTSRRCTTSRLSRADLRYTHDSSGRRYVRGGNV